MNASFRCLLVVLLGLSVWAKSFGQAPAASPSAPEVVQEGTLPNGLRYLIFPHVSSKGDASVHLVVRAGSLDEHDDERGFAHFVEHMAFSGTKNYPPSAIRILLQRMGVSMGADLNAMTGYNSTNYQLDLQSAEEAKLDEALAILRDFADGISFDFDQVLRESGVVISELKERESAMPANTMTLLRAIYAGTKVADRQVRGVVEQLQGATPEQLRGFYQRNYQPGRMTVVVVGPVDPAVISRKITSVFGSIPKAAEDLPAARVEVPAGANTTKPQVVGVPPPFSALIEFLHHGQVPPATPDGRRQLLLQRLAVDLLNTRLRVRVSDEDPGRYSLARATFEIGPANLIREAITMTAATDDWTGALDVAEPELRRIRTEGFTAAEVTEVATGLLGSLQGRVRSFSGQTAARVAASICQAIVTDAKWLPPAEELAEATPTLQGLTATQVTAALNEVFPPDATQVIITVPTSARLTSDRVQAALKKTEGRALRKRSVEKPLVFKYQDFGAPGAVAKRDHVDDLDLTLVTFANDVRLNVRPSVLEPERFRLRIVFPENLSFVPLESGGIAELAGYFLTSANPKKHSVNEMIRLMRLNDVAPQFSVNVGTPILQISGPSASLKFALQFLAATFSDLNLDEDNFRAAINRYAGLRQAITRSPSRLAPLEALHVFTGNDKRALLRPYQALASKRDEVQGWLQTHLINGPMEIGLVGDVDVDDAINTAAATLGTLKKRRPVEKTGPAISWPKKSERQETPSESAGSTSATAVLWPVALPDTPRNNAALTLATDIYEDRMHLILRESLGANYSTSVNLHRDIIQRDFAFVQLLATFDPGKAREMTLGSIRVASQMADRGVLKEEFERLREPARERAATDLRDNNWWLVNVVAPAQRRPESIEAARSHEKLYDELTIDDVNTAAKVFRADLSTALIATPASAGKKK